MNENGKISRRAFIQSLAGAGALAVLTYGTVRFSPSGQQEALLEKLGQFDLDHDALKSIADAFWKQHPEESILDTLLNSIIPDRNAFSSISSANSLQKSLTERIRNDYDTDRVLNLEGWVLSITELRLAALVTLTASNASAA